MKPLSKIVILFSIIVIIISCNKIKKERNINLLSPLKIEIPIDIKNNTELVDLIRSCEKSINEFSDSIEQLVVNRKNGLLKKEEDYSTIDAIKAGKLIFQLVSYNSQMTMSFEKFNKEIRTKQLQGDINEKQIRCLNKVRKSFEDRINKINKKYEDIYD